MREQEWRHSFVTFQALRVLPSVPCKQNTSQSLHTNQLLLSQFCLCEEHMPPDPWVILDELQLLGQLAWILLDNAAKQEKETQSMQFGKAHQQHKMSSTECQIKARLSNSLEISRASSTEQFVENSCSFLGTSCHRVARWS
jgi:hypothetical protein